MAEKNLSEELFKPRFKHPETSSLVHRQHHPTAQVHNALEGDTQRGWYRMLNKLLWTWRGLAPQEISEVLARIAVSKFEHTDETLLDTVIGYRGGNWNYEWSKQAALWQQRAMQNADHDEAGQQWLHAASLYSLAAYPYIKGDELADQAQVLANRAYEEATQRLPGELKSLTFPISGGSPVTGFLHMPAQASAPYPTVLLCGGLDSLQSDHYRLFHDYLAPRGIAMLTLDMPSVGFSSKWTLNQDTSQLHQQVLRELSNVPWIDHTRVALFGYRFGATWQRDWLTLRCRVCARWRRSGRWCITCLSMHSASSNCRICIWTCWPAGWACRRPPTAICASSSTAIRSKCRACWAAGRRCRCWPLTGPTICSARKRRRS